MVSVRLMKKLSLVAFLCLTLAACSDRAAIVSQFEDRRDEADVALSRMEPRQGIRPALTVEDRSWFGSRAVRLQNGQPLPDELNTEESLVITFDRPMNMNDLARQIQSITGMRVVVPPRPSTATNTRTQGSAEEENLFLPTDGIEVAGGRILWQGRLRDLLNQISDFFDSEWSHRNGIIYMNATVSRTFTLYALAGNVSISGTVQSGSSGGSGNLPTQSVGSDVTLSIWEEVENAVNGMMGQNNGTATFSPATGTVTVNASPSAVQKVEEYLRQLNNMRLRRIAVVVRVLSIDVNREFDYGFDLQGVLERAFKNQPFFYSSTAAGGLAAGVVRTFPVGVGGLPDLRRPSPATGGDGDTVDPLDPAGQTDSGQAIIRALATAGRVSIVHTGAIVTLSDQPAPLQIARQQTYVARVSAAASGDSSSTSLEPGTVEEGLTLNILPRVIEKDRVLLRIGMGITQIRQIRQLEAGDGLRIELPDLDTTGFLQNMVLSNGETLVMAGFERNRTNTEDRGTGTPQNIFLGGRQQFSSSRNVTVLMMSSEILPEDPFGVQKR